MAAYDGAGLRARISILSFGTEPGFIPYHSIALIGTPSPSIIIPSCLATLATD
jgi:hypothetical protein